MGWGEGGGYFASLLLGLLIVSPGELGWVHLLPAFLMAQSGPITFCYINPPSTNQLFFHHNNCIQTKNTGALLLCYFFCFYYHGDNVNRGTITQNPDFQNLGTIRDHSPTLKMYILYVPTDPLPLELYFLLLQPSFNDSREKGNMQDEDQHATEVSESNNVGCIRIPGYPRLAPFASQKMRLLSQCVGELNYK